MHHFIFSREGGRIYLELKKAEEKSARVSQPHHTSNKRGNGAAKNLEDAFGSFVMRNIDLLSILGRHKRGYCWLKSGLVIFIINHHLGYHSHDIILH